MTNLGLARTHPVTDAVLKERPGDRPLADRAAAAGQDPLRILHVSEVHWGGVVTLLRHFTEQQAAAGHQVHVLSPAAMPHLPGAVRHSWRVDRGRPWTAGSSILDLRQTLHSVRPDVVHLHSFVAGAIARLPGRPAWLGTRVPTVYQPHAWSFDLFQRPGIGYAMRRWETSAARRTDVLVANCEDEIREGQALGITVPAHALGVAVNMQEHAPVDEEERHRHREELGLTARHVLVCVGRLSRQKGQDLLLRAWERCRPPDTLLVLVGPGDCEALQQHAPSQWGKTVLWVGEHSDVRPWLWASDALVLCSRYETVGLVVAEAMSCGRPVVATAVNGAWTTIVDGPLPAAGAVVPLGEMDLLLQQARRRLDDSALRAAESLAARRRAADLFAPAGVSRRLEAAYRQALIERQERKPAW